MRVLLPSTALALVAFLTTACGGPAVGCDFREEDDEWGDARCQERSGFSTPAFMQLCEVSGGKVVEGGCPTEGIVAGCNQGMQGDGTAVIDWYYAPETVESVTLICEDERGELILL